MAAGRHNLHATAVALEGRAILLQGASGSGKSDLALRLIEADAVLVADDQTLLRREGDRVICSAPPEIAGRIEVRGFAIVEVPYEAEAPLALVVEMKPLPLVERLPEPRSVTLLGVDVPAIDLYPFEASAVAKLKLALRHISRVS
jgi:HPr kinase/phosphorylase